MEGCFRWRPRPYFQGWLSFQEVDIVHEEDSRGRVPPRCESLIFLSSLSPHLSFNADDLIQSLQQVNVDEALKAAFHVWAEKGHVRESSLKPLHLLLFGCLRPSNPHLLSPPLPSPPLLSYLVMQPLMSSPSSTTLQPST